MCAAGLTAQRSYPAIGSIVRLDPRLDSLIEPGAKIEVLASGFEWSEGPVWVPRDGGFLLFSDVPRNTVYRWTQKDGITVFLKPSGYTGAAEYSREPGSNGLTLDLEGRLLSCEHGDRRVSRLEWDGGKRTLADNYGGKRFNSPNDLVVHSSGAIYFTDPPYGLPQQDKDPRRELDVFGVYRISTSGEVTLLVRDLTRPNGIGFSPDEKTLYVAQSDPQRPVIMAYAVKGDGTLGGVRVFADSSALMKQRLPGLPDGLRVDASGNVWATGPGGVHVYAADRTLLGRIDTGEATANCTIAPDGTLYITSDMYLCRVRTKTKPIR